MELEKTINSNKNYELQELLELVQEEPIFFNDNKRLLSKSEIENYKKDLEMTIDVIPLIDLGDNVFIVFDNTENKFKKCDISEGTLYGTILEIGKYTEEIYENLYSYEQLEKIVSESNCKAELICELGRRYYNGINIDKDYKLAVQYFEKASNLGNTKAKLKLAVCMLLGKGISIDYENAYNIFNELTEKYNNKDAKYFIGRMYLFGNYFELDYKKAYEIFSELANAHTYSKYRLAEMYYWGNYVEKDYEKAYNMFKELAEREDDRNAKYYLGEMYYFGYYVEQNYEKAYNIYQELAEKYDNKDSKYYLGQMYYCGRFVDKDYEKAYNIFQELVEKYQDNYSKYYIGLMYYNGYYVVQDIEKSLKIFEELAKNNNDKEAFEMLSKAYRKGNWKNYKCVEEIVQKYNNPKAKQILGYMNYYGDGTEENDSEALKLLKDVEQIDKNGEISYYIGIIYYRGKGVERNFENAHKYFKKSAELGDIDGKYYLGQTYLQGDGVEQDDKKAIYWIEQAANEGLNEAQFVLGKIYYYGEEMGMKVTNDQEYAIQLLEKAAKAGNEKAVKELEKIRKSH